ncbi:hypothetical protein FGADI_12878 [Fusarium gaditjirri]|uniref:Uncharacterized protein n=1 Tax=Fusarium gaditjirri TaxID=282569 RepID=A0A8H4WNK6_9HYPO|nr:hypothetical protein FGADI_12878 [Fusarium gaditjirri]
MQICPKTFVLVHAVQILLFAPMDWDKERSYSRDEEYARWFPTPPAFGEALPAVTGNLNVDVCTALLESAQSTHPKITIAARLAEAKIKDMEPLSKANFKAVMNLLNSIHPKQDFDAKLTRIQETLTHVDKFILEHQISDFTRIQEESEVIIEFRRANPDKEAELIKLSRQQYSLEHVMSSLQPESPEEGLESLCETFGIAPWPDLRL